MESIARAEQCGFFEIVDFMVVEVSTGGVDCRSKLPHHEAWIHFENHFVIGWNACEKRELLLLALLGQCQQKCRPYLPFYFQHSCQQLIKVLSNIRYITTSKWQKYAYALHSCILKYDFWIQIYLMSFSVHCSFRFFSIFIAGFHYTDNFFCSKELEY